MSASCIFYPSPFQLSLALAVAKTKPNDLSVRGYIETLRERLSTRQDASPYAKQSYIDGLSHWKKMYEQAVKEKTSLESENATLRHELEELQCEANERQIQAAQTGRKRGRDGAVQPPAKRVQLVKGASNAKSTQAEAAGSNYDTLGYGTEGSLLLYHLFRSQRLLKDPHADISDLAHHLVGTASNVAILLVQACKQLATEVLNQQSSLPTTVQRQPNDIAQMLPALARAFTSLLFGLSHLEEKDSERSGTDNIEGAVVYSYVTAFGNILDAATLCCLARSCLDFEVTDEEKANIPKRKKDASKARLTQQVVEAPKLISNLLLAVVSQLSPTQRTHRKLFEGYLYVILSRVAECLNIVHFGRERSNVQIRVTAPEGRVCSAAEEERGIAYEGVVLGKLLERTNSLAPSFLSQVDIGTAPDKRKPGRRKTAQNMAVSKPSGAKSSTKVLDKLTLPSLVRERLQRTLVDCMFGQIDDHFLECLTMPPRKSLKEPPRSKEEKVKMQEDPKGWFFDKVWDLVGWEILEKEDD